MTRIVYLDGSYLAEDEARISIFDRGFLMADAVYEVTGVLVIRRHRIFEVEIDYIGRTGRHFFKQRRARAGAEKLAAVEAGRGGGLDSEAHLVTIFR